MKINLVQNGVFPLVKDIEGNIIKNDTEWEFSGTFQGEGIWSGIPCFFIRTTGCNLRCIFSNSMCDTAYSSFYPEKNILEIDDIIKLININNIDNNIKHIVISGGEPTIQMLPLIELCKQLKQLKYIITIETNGTIYNDELRQCVDLFSISPKLLSSTPSEKKLEDLNINKIWSKKHESIRKNLEVLQNYIDYSYNYQLKFVVSNEQDIIEINEEYLKHLKGYSKLNILLMPEGINEEQLKINNKIVSKLSVKYGYRFCPRLHIDIFGGAKKGV